MKKVTEERTRQMIGMRKKGSTYEDIGKAFNISKQRVYSLIGDQVKNRFKEITSESCVYPNLRKWMNDNRITRAKLCEMLYGNRHPVNRNYISSFLKGNTQRVTRETIDKYLMVTGLTYEELFETKGE